jgi:transcriptional antiterminator NusG
MNRLIRDNLTLNWYAIYTRSRHEQKVYDRLREKEIEVFLPLIQRWSRRKDRKKSIRVPLFPGYLFVRTQMDQFAYYEILKTKSVVRILCSAGVPAPIPDEQIHGIQILMKNNIAITPCQYLKAGERARVVNGPLTGIEGILIKIKPNKNRLVLSVDLIKESVSVELDEIDVEPIHL